jgi:class 3 adenylate cyclase/tetratricopeptide (TPR) repeat protein
MLALTADRRAAAADAVRAGDKSGPTAEAKSAAGTTQVSVDPGLDRDSVEERKLATVLFADVVGFTTLSEETDHEAVARLVDSAFRELGEVVAAHGGSIDKYMGDSVMAVFGVPVAHDDDAERAVAAGLAMRELEGDLAFSIGINSGEVTATTFGGDTNVTVIGDAVNVAARLEKVAGPGEVLCGRLTAELAGGGVRFREREAVVLKGKRQPVEVFEAVALRANDPTPAGDTPLIGRDDELNFLESQWRRVRRDRAPHFVLLCGDAGSGKTRLMAELARAATGTGTVVWASYPAYGPMGGARVASQIAAQLGPSTDAEVEARVRSMSGEKQPSLRAIDPAAMRQEQTWGFVRLIQEKCSEHPLLIVIDDAHRSGDRTLEMLVEIATRLSDIPLMTVLSGRTEPGGWLTRFPTAMTIRLSPLGPAESAALAEQLIGGGALAPEFSDFLVERAAGNPLYIRELLAMAKSNGAGCGGEELPLTLDGALPASLHALLAGRLDGLGRERKRLIQRVAVFGDAASAVQVSALGGDSSPSALNSLVEEGLLRVSKDGFYDIADPLLREVAYETLSRHARGSLHTMAAAAMERPEERARHLDHAADYIDDDVLIAAAAADALADAGIEFLASSRYLDALTVLERALARGCRKPSALLELANLQNMAGRHDDALATLDLIADDPADPSLAIERDHSRANTVVFVDPQTAAGSLDDIAARWRAIGNKGKEAWAYSNLGVALFNLSRLHEAGDCLERALVLFDDADDEAGALAASSFLCIVKPTDKRVPGWLARSLEFADAVGDKSKQVSTLTTHVWHHFFRTFCGNEEQTEEAQRSARRLYELTEELGAHEVATHARGLMAIVKRLAGNFDEAAEHLAVLRRLVVLADRHEPWFGWAVSFAITVSLGATASAPPYPPLSSLDPVDAMARLVIDAELMLAGRLDEALASFESPPTELGPLVDLSGLVYALMLSLDGRGDEALGLADRAVSAADALGATQAAIAARAVRAEIVGDVSGLPPWAEGASSLSEILVARAYASVGDTAALESFNRDAERMRMPGLLLAPVVPVESAL